MGKFLGIDEKYFNPIHAVDDALHWANKNTPKNTPDFRVSYSSNNGVQVQANPIQTTGYNYGNVRSNTTTAYKANTAGTANKIAQGGMTKDDILKYNSIHPNEIAGDNPANNTALNTNTALRS